MNIIYATDNGYSKLVLVSLKSLFMHNADVDEINVYIIDDKIEQQNKACLEALAKEYRRNIVFLPLSDKYAKLYSTISGRARVSAVVYSYCYFQDILPQSVERALMLEGDCMVCGSLRELYDMDLTGYYFAAADDLHDKYFKKKLGMNPASPYVNSGVILFNFKAMRDDNFTEKITQIIKSGNSEFFYEAQDELNVAAEGKVKVVAPKYNCTTTIFLFDQYKHMLRYRNPSTVCTKEEYEEARKNPVIVHFTTNQIMQPRPWIVECTHPYKQQYLEIKADTVLADEPLWPRKKQGIKKLFSWLYLHGAQGLVATVLRPVHAFLFPMFLYKYL